MRNWHSNIRRGIFTLPVVFWFFILSVCLPRFSPAAESSQKTVVIPLFEDAQQNLKTSYLSIPYTAFSGSNNSLGTILGKGACWNNNGTIIVWLQAPVFLPHGAIVKEITVHYYYYYPYDSRTVQMYRMNTNGDSTTMATVDCADQYNNHSTTSSISAPIIDNSQYTYYLWAFGFNCDRKHAISWVRIKYQY